MKLRVVGLLLNFPLIAMAGGDAGRLGYVVVDTGQVRCYDNHTEIAYPEPGNAFAGQDALYRGHQPAYEDHGDGTISDRHTGLMWQADPGDKRTYAQAVAGAGPCRTGGYADWRLPSIKELYSLIQFSGTDPDPMGRDTTDQTPFIDTRFFAFRYGDTSRGERIIDSQFATSTRYLSTTMGGNETMFGLNLADGRIKGYPIGPIRGRGEKTYHVLYVRENPAYGKNLFTDHEDGTITDRATGLTWMTVDSGAMKAGRKGDGALNWQEALQWAETLEYAGHDDWRLPNAKELHTIVDYTRSPDATHSAAMNPLFQATPITNEGGKTDYGQYWTSTSHVKRDSAESAVYIAFGRALGFMPQPGSRDGQRRLLDVHGAGAQRCDAKSGDPASLPQGRGPQGDVSRIYNLVRCVRGGAAEPATAGPPLAMVQTTERRPGGRNQPGEPPPRADFVSRLDRNGDGKISEQEFDGPAQHFPTLDRDGDGFITPSEAPSGPPGGVPPRRR